MTHSVSGRAKIDNGELYYEVAGSGRPVILLHGGLLTSQMWDEQYEMLADTHRVVRVDARAHGKSSTPTEAFAYHEDVRDLLDVLDIERATLVGLSGGARAAINFGLTYPRRTEALVLVAPGIDGMQTRDPVIIDLMSQLMTVTDTAAGVEIFLRMWVDGPLRTPEQVSPAVRKRCLAMAMETVSRHNPASQGLARELDAIHRVAELRMPILAMVGDLDSSDIHEVVDLVVKEAAAARKMLIPGAGHNISLEQREAFRLALLDFLRETQH
ncbi:alpha/beta fold hydrolase [Fodinicola feengrottensis]|uniref:Alpha/beta hydrolase n=1 Tax=Fodinicola feengrottensis TaxID=435914 RepID=A0ABP4SNI3_9ACTN|nr:alpha/beta hydrolase [Fodinicola feengrottensis]